MQVDGDSLVTSTIYQYVVNRYQKPTLGNPSRRAFKLSLNYSFLYVCPIGKETLPLMYILAEICVISFSVGSLGFYFVYQCLESCLLEKSFLRKIYEI